MDAAVASPVLKTLITRWAMT